MDSEKDAVLVVSAHAADFVWRAGGAIALYASRGCRVRVLCLSFGERGESEKLWSKPGMTLDQVKINLFRGRNAIKKLIVQKEEIWNTKK